MAETVKESNFVTARSPSTTLCRLREMPLLVFDSSDSSTLAS